MAATVRYDDQYCPIARALDVLGDRWTLLVLRELVSGENRFTDLRRALPGMTATLLSQRLRVMEDQGLVTSVPQPPPSKRSLYAVTPRGREAVPVMRSLVRFGMPLLEPVAGREVRPWMAVSSCVEAWFDPDAAEGIDERYLIRIGGQEFALSSVAGGGKPRDPDLVAESDAALWVELRQGATTVREALRSGRLHVTGPRRVLTHMQRVFRLP